MSRKEGASSLVWIYPLIPRAFCQKCIFLVILELFSLQGMGQITCSSDVLEKTFILQLDFQHAFLFNSVAFATFLLGHVLKSKFCLFFRLSFFPFSCPLAAVIGPLFGLASRSKTSESVSIMEMGNFCHGIATCSGSKFCFEFFTQKFLIIFVYSSCEL